MTVHEAIVFELKPGMQVWFESYYSYNPSRLVLIQTVGRRWAYIADSRYLQVELTSGEVVDTSSKSRQGRVWPSEQAYAEHKARTTAWNQLCDDIYRHRNAMPLAMTVERVAELRKQLGLVPR